MNNKNILIILICLILVNSVSAFELTSSETEKSVCPSSTILLNANVLGSGNFNINIDGSASKWAIVVPQGFTLYNEAKLLYIYVTPKFDTNPGFYNLNLIVANEKNEVKKINYKINIPDCHNLLISGTESKEVCGCTSNIYNFTISNNGIYQEAYKVEVTGKSSPWIRLSQDTLTLLPGQSKTIYAFLNVPCGSDFGENSFSISVRSLTSKTVASFDSNVIVNSCFDFSTSLEKEFVNMCEHSSEVIPLIINNLADLDNEFDLKITGPAWASLHSTKLNLKAKESGIINIILNPDYKVEGTFDVNIKIDSKESKISKDIKIKVNVRKCNDVSFELFTREDKLCVGSKKTYEANLKNLGEFEKEFRIETTHGWVKPEEIVLTLGAGQSKKINIDFNPSENITAQNYDIKFRALALDSSRISSEDEFKLNLISREQCYKPEVNVKDIEVNADSSATSSISIKNIGAELAVYEIGLTGNANSFSQLNPSVISLEPGKSELVYLYVAPPYDIKPGNYKSDIIISLKNAGILESKEINIKVNEAGIAKIPGKDLWQRIVDFIKNLSPQKDDFIDINKENTINKNVKFDFKNETHSLKILEVINSTVTISIESEPLFILLDLNETEKVDLDKDGKIDLNLRLSSFDKDGNPVIIINKETQETKKIFDLSSLKNLKEKFYDYKIPILIGVIILIGIVLFFATNTHKKLIKYLDEESKEEEPLKIGRYILLIIALLVLFWYVRAYPNHLKLLFDYLATYKIYIIAGLIILIFLILIINYWKQIVDFFEEDADEKKKKNR